MPQRFAWANLFPLQIPPLADGGKTGQTQRRHKEIDAHMVDEEKCIQFYSQNMKLKQGR